MIIVKSEGLTKSYGKVHAVNNLSLEIEENKITGLIGRNGAGKTTLLKLLAGYLKPSRGELRVFGQNPFNTLGTSGNTIFVDDNMSFPDSFSLSDILREAAPFYANWNGKLAQGLFDYFGLNPRQRHSNLSKGSKSLFNSIIGIAARCPLTLLDEPTTGMDSAVRKDFYRALLKDYLEYPRTIILSSHLLGELGEFLEDILLLDRGTKYLHLPALNLQEYALGLRGKAQTVLSLIENLEIIHKEDFAKEGIFVVVKADQLQISSDNLKQNGIETIPVPIDDLCVYLTAKTKGGIDDVFKNL